MLRRLRPLLVVTLTVVLLAVIVSGCTKKTAAPAGQQDKGVVISYNTPAEWANWKVVLKSFEDEAGIKAPSDNKNSGQTVSQLIAEKANPQCDVAYYGITYAVKAAKSGLLDSYQPQHSDEIPAELHAPDWTWFTLHYGAVAFVVNKDALGSAPVPQSFADLLKPEYKGKVGFLDPTSAFTGYASCVAANIAMGGTLDNWAPGITYLRKLEANGAIHPKQTATAQIEKGEIPIMIDYDFNGYHMHYVDQANIEVIIPQEGSIIVPYVISLVKNAPHLDNAKKFLDYCMSDKGQAAFADGFVIPIRKGVMKAETQAKFLPSTDYARAKSIDYAKMGTSQDQFVKLWLSQVATAK